MYMQICSRTNENERNQSNKGGKCQFSNNFSNGCVEEINVCWNNDFGTPMYFTTKRRTPEHPNARKRVHSHTISSQHSTTEWNSKKKHHQRQQRKTTWRNRNNKLVSTQHKFQRDKYTLTHTGAYTIQPHTASLTAIELRSGNRFITYSPNGM